MSVSDDPADPSRAAWTQIKALRERGFRFIDPRDEEGEVVALVGIRVHDEVIDVVRLHGEDDAVAARLPSDADILAPHRVFWEQAGTAGEVLDKLLALPDDRVPGAPRTDASSLISVPACR
ncbi:MAG TPA: hypothetical protein VFV67_01755 [Actinophytocola sp.]|uniref:hypothetical protein n=1 Tax=Actinophytocola sp. TaxID=1872138 RepID=UPI002DBB0E86|nr:hypothetical protein [Actinophytocola sp.]HEU5469349.1 hypothetical protein [Actinophytocola sp.]